MPDDEMGCGDGSNVSAWGRNLHDLCDKDYHTAPHCRWSRLPVTPDFLFSSYLPGANVVFRLSLLTERSSTQDPTSCTACNFGLSPLVPPFCHISVSCATSLPILLSFHHRRFLAAEANTSSWQTPLTMRLGLYLGDVTLL
jgi:hypothetical protein